MPVGSISMTSYFFCINRLWGWRWYDSDEKGKENHYKESRRVDSAGVRLVRVIGRKDTPRIWSLLDAGHDSRNPLDYIKELASAPQHWNDNYLIQGILNMATAWGNTGSILDGECQ